MQTNFSTAQLIDPSIAEAEKILRRCVHCGLCTATCPTYVLLGDERDSPRGRIYAIKDTLEKGAKDWSAVSPHIDRCLTCLSCMTTCPSGVDYMHLVDIARQRIEDSGRRPWKDRFVRGLLAMLVPYPRRFALALKAAPMAARFRGLFGRLGLHELAAMLDLAPKRRMKAPRYSGAGTAKTERERTARSILMTGCAQQVLRPEINDATIRLLARRGVDVVVASGAGCCGALVQHMGRDEEAKALARRNVDAWSKQIAREPVDAIIINASGCGTTVKDYGHMLARDTVYAERAQKISALTVDISEFLARHDIGPPVRWSGLNVAYHAACSLQHGQRVTYEPKTLLKNAGYTTLEIAESHLCCGSAGVYNILQPKIATALRDRKLKNIHKLRPDIIAAGNIGCITQLAAGTETPVVHTVELLDWAYGGPVPAGLEHLQSLSTPVPKARHAVEDYIS